MKGQSFGLAGESEGKDEVNGGEDWSSSERENRLKDVVVRDTTC